MKNRKNIFIYITVGLAFAIVVSGMILIWYLIAQLRDRNSDAEDRHLTEQASDIDADLMRRLRIIASTISGTVLSEDFRVAEDQYVEFEGKDLLSDTVRESVLCQSENALETLVLYEGKEVFRFAGKDSSGGVHTVVPENIQEPYSLICDQEGNACIAFSVNSQDNDITYITVFSMLPVLSDIGKTILTEDASVLFYDGKTSILVTDNANGLKAECVKNADASGSDMAKTVCSIEESGDTDTRICVVTDDQNSRREMAVSIIPSNESMNGRFAVGVVTDYTAYLQENINTSRRIVLLMSLVLAVLFCLFFLILFFHRSNEKHKKEAEELNELNREAEERLKNTQALERRERLETIGVLTSSLAHEFNNLLTPIMGYSAMSLADLSDEDLDLAENLAEIYKASSRAKHLIARMTSFSRGNDASGFQELSPDTVMEDVRLMAKPAVPGNVTVDYSLNCPEPCIYGDRMQLVQMFLNIVLNAIQAIGDAPGTLTIHTEQSDGKVTATFTDTGKGMTEEELKQIFEPFYTTKGADGTGLGLPISKRIAKAHGAELTVRSTPGKGTVFTIVFPEKSVTHS